jgi:hypothetical protein
LVHFVAVFIGFEVSLNVWSSFQYFPSLTFLPSLSQEETAPSPKCHVCDRSSCHNHVPNSDWPLIS